MASNIPEGYNADGEISGSAEDNPTLSGINEWEDTTDQE